MAGESSHTEGRTRRRAGARLVASVALAVLALTLVPQLAEMGDAAGKLPVAPGQPAGAR